MTKDRPTIPRRRRPSGAATDAGNAAPTPEVRAMFDRIARVYDPMNLAISAFQEPYWRRRLVRVDGPRPRHAGARRRVGDRQGRRRSPHAGCSPAAGSWAWTSRPA